MAVYRFQNDWRERERRWAQEELDRELQLELERERAMKIAPPTEPSEWERDQHHFPLNEPVSKASSTATTSTTVTTKTTASTSTSTVSFYWLKLNLKNLKFMGGGLTSEDQTQPTILRPRVRTPAQHLHLAFSNLKLIYNVKKTKINKNRPWLAHIFRKKLKFIF